MKTIELGGNVWMSENLNIEVAGSVDNGKHGRLYSHSEAQEAVRLYNEQTGENWRLPSNQDWIELADSLGGKDIAGKKLKSTTGWDEDGNGTNESGLNMLPGGYYNGGYGYKGAYGYWWSAESYGIWHLYYNNAYLSSGTYNSNYRFSVRCVKGICEEDCADVDNSAISTISEEAAIKVLKNKGYKILKPVTKFKEV